MRELCWAWIELEIRGDVDAAIKEYCKVVELRPDLPEAYNNLGVAQKSKGDLSSSGRQFEQGVEAQTEIPAPPSAIAAGCSRSRTNGAMRGGI